MKTDATEIMTLHQYFNKPSQESQLQSCPVIGWIVERQNFIVQLLLQKYKHVPRKNGFPSGKRQFL